MNGRASRVPRGGAAVLDDVGFLGGEVGGEVVAAGTIRARHEIQIVRVGGVQDRGYGRDTRIGDRSGRQPRMLVGVIRVAADQVGFVNGAAIVSGEQGRVDRGRVAIELHPDGQAAGENGSDDGPLVRELAFLFHQRGQRDGAVYGSVGAQAAPDFAELDRKSTRLNSSHLVISYA